MNKDLWNRIDAMNELKRQVEVDLQSLIGRINDQPSGTDTTNNTETAREKVLIQTQEERIKIKFGELNVNMGKLIDQIELIGTPTVSIYVKSFGNYKPMPVSYMSIIYRLFKSNCSPTFFQIFQSENMTSDEMVRIRSAFEHLFNDMAAMVIRMAQCRS